MRNKYMMSVSCVLCMTKMYVLLVLSLLQEIEMSDQGHWKAMCYYSVNLCKQMLIKIFVNESEMLYCISYMLSYMCTYYLLLNKQ